MGNTKIKVLCYADDAVLIAETEDNLQKFQQGRQEMEHGNLEIQNKIDNHRKRPNKM